MKDKWQWQEHQQYICIYQKVLELGLCPWKVKRNQQSLVLLDGVDDTMKQSWMEKLLPATEGVAMQAWTMQQEWSEKSV